MGLGLKEEPEYSLFLSGCALQGAGRIPARLSVGTPGGSQGWVPESQLASLQVCQEAAHLDRHVPGDQYLPGPWCFSLL